MRIIDNKEFAIIFNYNWRSNAMPINKNNVEIYVSKYCEFDIFFINESIDFFRLTEALREKFKYNAYCDFSYRQRKYCISYNKKYCRESEIINVGNFIVRYLELENFS